MQLQLSHPHASDLLVSLANWSSNGNSSFEDTATLPPCPLLICRPSPCSVVVQAKVAWAGANKSRRFGKRAKAASADPVAGRAWVACANPDYEDSGLNEKLLATDKGKGEIDGNLSQRYDFANTRLRACLRGSLARASRAHRAMHKAQMTSCAHPTPPSLFSISISIWRRVARCHCVCS